MLSLEKAMKCPKCGFNSFDYLDTCKKCGSPLEAKPGYRVVHQSVAELRGQKSMNIDENTISKDETAKPIISSISPEHGSSPEESLKFTEKEEGIAKPPISSSFLPPDYDSLPEESSQFKEKEETLSFNLAGVSSRVVAFLVDLIILFGMTTLTLGIGLFVADMDFNVDVKGFMSVLIPLYFILLFLSSTYFVFLQGFGGRTLGKMIFGIRVIRDDGESIGLWEALIRWLGYFISALFIFIGFIWALFDSKSQAWHDKFAGTYVVKE